MTLDFEVFSSLDGKILSPVGADEGADLYTEGMCSPAFLGGNALTQIQAYPFWSSLPCVYEMAPRGMSGVSEDWIASLHS